MRNEFKNKKILIMGLGLQNGGMAVAKFLAKQRAKITITDLRTKKELEPSLKKLKNLPIKYYLGKHPKNIFRENEIVVASPAISLNSPYLKIAQKHGTKIQSEIGIFINLTSPKTNKIIAVTGAKGKTTTVSLIARLLKTANKKFILGGNLGKSLLSDLKKIDSRTYVLLELSSFQLELLKNNKNFKPFIAVLTNIYEDHLDRYPNLRHYIQAKKIIFQNQTKKDFAVINESNFKSLEVAKKIKARRIFFNLKKERKILKSLNIPITLRGDHSLENILAVIKAAKILKIPKSIIKKTIKNFPGVEHRIEFVREINGVKFFNDSASTTPVSTIAALNSFQQPIILIAGGASKNLNFKKLGQKIAQKVKFLITIGQTGSLIAQAASRTKKNINIEKTATLEKAVFIAQNKAKTDEIVLFSPASASLDMFLNSRIRGEKFKKLVNKLSPTGRNRLAKARPNFTN
ncbi:MAG: UDP-N-acetylmuramoyl-L-alanine--D-glutamate ligase [Parcubacteria group bacterium]|nr:UDP-N-acetylmuramoyl-L-alanine--D-glutamate ligase [Parcubacteria group bacterium]